MEWTKKFIQEHIYIFSFMTALIAIGLLYICNVWIFKSDNGMNYDLNHILAYLIPLIFVFTACFFQEVLARLNFIKKA